MKHLELIRNEHTNDYTVGTIGEIGKEPICLTIELGWRNNARNISCIPTGEYVLRRHVSSRFNPSIKVFDKDGRSEVPGRVAILFHAGNYINFLQNGKILNDSEGCILPVTNIASKTATGIFGASSAVQMRKLFDFVGNDTVNLTVRNAQEIPQAEQNNNTSTLQEEKKKTGRREFSYIEIKTTDGNLYKFPADEIESITKGYEVV